MTNPTHEKLMEEISAEIHTLYCKQYEKDNGKPYWTNGDYALLDERTKEYDRNIAHWHLSRIDAALKAQGEALLANLPKEIELLKEESNNNWFYGCGFNSCLSEVRTALNELFSKQI